MKSVLIAMIIAMSFSYHSHAEDGGVKKDLWKSTGLNWDDVKTFLNQDRCYTNENYFLGCITAMDAILGQSKDGQLLSNSVVATQAGAGAVITTQEGIEVRSYKKDVKLDDDESIAHANYIKETLAANKSWKDLYKTVSANRSVNFANLVTYAVSTLPSDLDLPETRAAEVIDQFYGTALDPHSHLMSEDEYKMEQSGESEVFYGIGSIIRIKSHKIYVEPRDNSPALKAGLYKGDQILAVDENVVPDRPILQKVVTQIKGPANTSVKISVQRGNKKLEFTIPRGPVDVPFMEQKLLTDSSGQKTGYIKLRDFMAANPCEKKPVPTDYTCFMPGHVPQQGTCDQFAKAAQDLQKQGATKLILDLRSNPGGSLTEALCMVSLYAPPGEKLLSVHDPETNKVIHDYMTSGIDLGDNNRGSIYDMYKSPLTVLIDGSSASASELFTGALQDYRRSVIVGVQSYGKGTVQGGFPWKDGPKGKENQIVFFKTIQRFHLPSGRSNQLVGLTPDFEVYDNPHPTAEDKLFLGREKDSFVNPIMPSSQPYQPDQKLVSKVKSCIDGKKDLEAKYNLESTKPLGADFQLMYAEEVAACL